MRTRKAFSGKGVKPLFRATAAVAPLFAASFAGCRAAPPPQPMPGAPVEGQTLSRFQVEIDGSRVGFLVEASFAGPIGEKRFLVQNAFGQQIGFVDAQGRAFRFRASDGEPEHCATGTMEENLKSILRLARLPKISPLSP